MSKQEINKREFKITEIVENIKASGMDRRTFLIRMAMAGVAASLPLTMCSPGKREGLLPERDPAVLTEQEWNILNVVQGHLFPSEENSPGSKEINAAAYVQWVLSDVLVDPEERDFLKSGLTRLDSAAEDRWGESFLSMLPENQEKLLQYIESLSWGESWLSAMLMYIFEALLSDPIYGANTNEAGWKWLGFTPGEPRPKTIYSDQLTMIKNNEKF